jgi:isopentenyl diphosphate isomerase/L-lactate dehydrogenase-like FMN-dependent dehydrogenase
MAMYRGLSSARFNPSNATWDWVGRLKKMTSMKVLVKGVETAEDARLAREQGADGIVVSNHGGRAAETLRPTIDIVPEVVDAVSNQIPVLVDGGVRRGSDVFKALAYGARAVGIGRPYTWGLATYGQEGVERVLEILNAELTMTMRQCGTPTLARITKAHIRHV